jgi:hypothetical protein
VRPTTLGAPLSHEAKGRSPLMFGADASHESAGRGNQIRQILSMVLALNLTVAGAKLDYGFVSGSVAMSADGFHSLLDGFRKVVGPETQAIVHVEPAEPPHTRPDPIFGHDFQLTTNEATGPERVQRPREGTT